MKCIKISGGILLLVLNVVLVILGLRSVGFAQVSLVNIITIDIAFGLSFYGVQTLIDRRRRVDFIIKKLDYIAAALSDEALFEHQCHDLASTKQRQIGNDIYFVSKAVPKSSEIKMEKITEAFERMRTYYGDHAAALAEDPFYEKEKTNIMANIAKVQMDIIGIDTGKEKYKQ